jgi:hypothetical protein
MYSAAPVSESTGRDPVEVKHIPPRVITTVTVARESVQLPIRLNDLGWMQSGILDGRAELLNYTLFSCYPSKGRRGIGMMRWSKGHLAPPSSAIIRTSQYFTRSTR